MIFTRSKVKKAALMLGFCMIMALSGCATKSRNFTAQMAVYSNTQNSEATAENSEGALTFGVSMTLPDGMALSQNEDGGTRITQGDEQVAVVSCTAYVPDKDFSPREDYYKYVYANIRISNVITSAIDYTEVAVNGETQGATALIGDDSAGGETPQYYQEILAYNDNLGVYIDVRFDRDIAEDDLKAIAESVIISE